MAFSGMRVPGKMLMSFGPVDFSNPGYGMVLLPSALGATSVLVAVSQYWNRCLFLPVSGSDFGLHRQIRRK